MPGVVPGSHVVPKKQLFIFCTTTRITGTSPVMTDERESRLMIAG